MKRILCTLLSLALFLSASSALALGYTGRVGNEATFETLEEARLNAPDAVKDLETNAGKTYVPHPALDGYPEGTVFIYRSANMYGGRASGRQNTVIEVFTEQSFESKADARAYLEELGLIAIIDEAVGSVVLVTPAERLGEGSSGITGGFGAADQQNYYKLQTAMFDLKGSGRAADGSSVNYADAEYYGGYSFFYVIGIDAGATFLNNYVMSTLDYVTRMGGLLLIGGDMERIHKVAAPLPVYLVDAKEAVINKYREVNGVNALIMEGDKTTEYNEALPLRRVVYRESAGLSNADIIKDAYYSMFIKAQRSQNLNTGYISASTPYQGYSQDRGPYPLVERDALINGVTVTGIHMFEFHEDRFKDIAMPDGEYLETWYEYLPEEALDGSAPDGSIPLLLLLHGGSDDPRLYVEEQGWLNLMGKKRLAAIAPEHQYISDVLPDVIPLFIRYMLDKYPALDPSRVYVNGYSLGGWATYGSLFVDASLFAAAVPQAMDVNVAMRLWHIANRAISEEEAKQFETIDMPLMSTTSEYDLFVDDQHRITESYLEPVNMYLGFNEMPPLPEMDYDQYPISGLKGDIYKVRMLNGEYLNHTWLYCNDAGVPMVGFNYTECATHGLYVEYANVAWDFMKHYRRDPETKAILYNPYAE